MRLLVVPVLFLGLTIAAMAHANDYSERYNAWSNEVESRIPADIRPIYDKPGPFDEPNFPSDKRTITNDEVNLLLRHGVDFYKRGDFAVAYKLLDKAFKELLMDAERVWYDSRFGARLTAAAYFTARAHEKVCEQSSACTDKYLGAQESSLGTDYSDLAKNMNEALAMVYADLAKEFGLAPDDPALPQNGRLSASDFEYAIKHCEMYKKKALEQPVPTDFWSKPSQKLRDPKLTVCKL